ncbi:hypothetical protein Tco_1493079 [Tanacetum coccineum]
MLSLRLVAGTASEDAYTLLRFIQKQIDEYGSHDGGKITVVTLVEEQMSPWKGNLPKLPIESNIVRLATTSIGAGLGSRGFKASILHLNSALGTSWDLLDQSLAAIDR